MSTLGDMCPTVASYDQAITSYLDSCCPGPTYTLPPVRYPYETALRPLLVRPLEGPYAWGVNWAEYAEMKSLPHNTATTHAVPPGVPAVQAAPTYPLSSTRSARRDPGCTKKTSLHRNPNRRAGNIAPPRRSRPLTPPREPCGYVPHPYYARYSLAKILASQTAWKWYEPYGMGGGHVYPGRSEPCSGVPSGISSPGLAGMDPSRYDQVGATSATKTNNIIDKTTIAQQAMVADDIMAFMALEAEIQVLRAKWEMLEMVRRRDIDLQPIYAQWEIEGERLVGGFDDLDEHWSNFPGL